jgi:hypothetical protein
MQIEDIQSFRIKLYLNSNRSERANRGLAALKIKGDRLVRVHHEWGTGYSVTYFPRSYRLHIYPGISLFSGPGEMEPEPAAVK